MRILVTGVSGQLGHDVCEELAKRNIECHGSSSREMDIRDINQIRSTFSLYRPDAVIHCAAYTKVDKAEEEPELCWAVNATGTENIALVCREANVKLLYISTVYVFPGADECFYCPDDVFKPQNIYGTSKLAGELAVKTLTDKYFIVRTSWVFGKNGGNFVKTMFRLSETHDSVRVVCDQVGSPTYTVDLAVLLCDMILTEKYGVYHATNEGICSWAEFAEEIFRIAEKNTKVIPVTSEEYAAAALRPKNSRMSKDKLGGSGFKRLPDWKDALRRYILTLKDEM